MENLVYDLCAKGNVQALRQLVEFGLKIKDYEQTEQFGAIGLLAYTAYRGTVDVAAFLLDQGLDVNFKDRHGRTALKNIRRDDEQMKKLFADAGAGQSNCTVM